jgi:hypothetical protein
MPAMDYAVTLHQIDHLQNTLVHDYLTDITGLPPAIRARLKAQSGAAETARGSAS